MTGTIGATPPQPAHRLDETARDRMAALSDARKAAGFEARRNAAESAERRSALLAEAQRILARVVGADTRISISRNENADLFVYRAIDIRTGQVVQEWPPAQFLAFLTEHGSETAQWAREIGLLIDAEA